MQLDEALRQISDIRRQMARGEVFRGYRAATIGFSGLLGVLAAVAQPYVVPAPGEGFVGVGGVVGLRGYLLLWIGVAATSILVAGIEVWWRARVSRSGLARQATLLAVSQFLPSIVVGALLTLCIYRGAPEAAWMLPGLWTLVFSLGIFASYRLLPPQVLWVGVYYAACGAWCLLWGQGARAFSPWLMGVSFGGGQLLAAATLYWTLERNDGSQS